MINSADALDLLARVDAKLHVYSGHISGSLCVRRPWAHVAFRGANNETIADTLMRALKELHRRQIEGMPRTTHTAPCGACGEITELRYVPRAKQWLCDECRRGLRAMGDDRRRARKRAAREGR